jgi:hypothetical protein
MKNDKQTTFKENLNNKELLSEGYSLTIIRLDKVHRCLYCGEKISINFNFCTEEHERRYKEK